MVAVSEAALTGFGIATAGAYSLSLLARKRYRSPLTPRPIQHRHYHHGSAGDRDLVRRLPTG